LPGFLQGSEIWILILLVILLVLGPTKLPQLARGVGQAMREFKKAAEGLTEEEIREVRSVASQSSSTDIDRETLLKLAEKLGVKTESKSQEELIREVIARAKERGLI
jgi:sec-independent protein translocase protein TatA